MLCGMKAKAKTASGAIVALLLVVAVLVLDQLRTQSVQPARGAGVLTGSPVGAERQPELDLAITGAATVVEAFRAERSGLMVQCLGTVTKVLPDDEQSPRHQRFVVKLGNGHTLLIAHNIDLAPRVPARRGESLEFRGQYEWNAQGGLVHWTHHDPDQRREGGWIIYDDWRYE